jgi:multidrug transporter EmrE-like cation transporter
MKLLSSWQIWILAMALFDGIHVSLIKHWSQNQTTTWPLVSSFAVLAAMNVMFITSFKNGTTIIESSFWYSTLTCIVAVVVGWLFHESITLIQVIGIALCVVGLWLLS